METSCFHDFLYCASLYHHALLHMFNPFLEGKCSRVTSCTTCWANYAHMHMHIDLICWSDRRLPGEFDLVKWCGGVVCLWMKHLPAFCILAIKIQLFSSQTLSIVVVYLTCSIYSLGGCECPTELENVISMLIWSLLLEISMPI